ncbi:hypothetical protein [Streptomyces sp. CRN 30]|uniref:hypothetical protein n=1 Tax=Streptomyces sp. CRN 30 TaxID=3075613 RepID=UPI002A811410|nr:hypothetical protein [Streptomyces sp. CRN 30]
MTVRRNVTPWAAAALALTALLATGCGGGEKTDDAQPEAGSSSATPHGYVEGAHEAAEQQSRLLLNDPESGATRVLDLITGKVTETDDVTGAARLTTDGRFGYLYADGSTHVLDSGSWMVDHGDHVHYYRAAVRDAGELPVGGAAQVRSDVAVTAATGEDGRAVLYDRGELEKGEVAPLRTLPGTYTAAVVPYEEHLVAVTGDGEPVVLDREGTRTASLDATCEDPRGDAVTRRGVVLACADGALLVHGDDGGFTAEKIAHDEKVPAAERAAAFRQRPGSDTLTATAGDDAVWVLDLGERTWTRVGTGTVVAAGTAGEGSPLLVLETDGRLHGYDIATGEETARTDRLLSGTAADRGTAGDTTAPVVEIDRSRAYVNDAAGKQVYEIDYNDDLRIARSFDLDIAPVLMAETGR